MNFFPSPSIGQGAFQWQMRTGAQDAYFGMFGFFNDIAQQSRPTSNVPSSAPSTPVVTPTPKETPKPTPVQHSTPVPTPSKPAPSDTPKESPKPTTPTPKPVEPQKPTPSSTSSTPSKTPTTSSTPASSVPASVSSPIRKSSTSKDGAYVNRLISQYEDITTTSGKNTPSGGSPSASRSNSVSSPLNRSSGGGLNESSPKKQTPKAAPKTGQALIDEANAIEDHMEAFKPLSQYTIPKDIVPTVIECFSVKNLPPKLLNWAVELTRTNVESKFGPSKTDLKEAGTYFLIACQKSGTDKKPIAFAQFRFLLNQEKNTEQIVLAELQVEKQYQRKGIGKRLFQLLELIGSKASMKSFVTSIQSANADGSAFLKQHGMALEGEKAQFVLYGKAVKPFKKN